MNGYLNRYFIPKKGGGGSKIGKGNLKLKQLNRLFFMYKIFWGMRCVYAGKGGGAFVI